MTNFKRFAIQDKETNNYLWEGSFQQVDNNKKHWMYITHTGVCNGMEYYLTIKAANNTLQKLERFNKKSKFNRKLHIVEFDKMLIPKGKMVIVEN